MKDSKSKFRASKIWKDFRKKFIGGKDYITDKKLYKGFNVHHLDLRAENYNDLSNEENFIALNKKTHDFVHWAYNYYKKDRYFIYRLLKVLIKMKEINK